MSAAESIHTGPQPENICAVVVAYYPDDEFLNRLERVLPQVASLVLVDNTPEPIALPRAFGSKWASQLHCISNAENKGIAAAVNQGMVYAKERGFSWLLTLDQDTTCHFDMVATLCETYVTCSPEVVVLGCNYLDPINQKIKASPQDGKLWLEQKTVITSGCLTNIDVAFALHGLREDYFIDQVDHEFCLRVRSHGYRVAITCKVAMEHSVGGPGGVRLPLFGVMPNHPPVRKYYIARNTVVTISLYWCVEPVWCVKRLLRLVLGLALSAVLEDQRLGKVLAFARGFIDGLRRRMGAA